MQIAEWDLLQDMLVDSAQASFAPTRVECTYRGAVPIKMVAWAQMLSIIGLGGSLHGSLVVNMSNELLIQTHPTKRTAAPELADWLAEPTRSS